MSIHVALNHVTHYRYDRPISLGPQVVRLRPAPHSRTRILSYSMRVEPAEHFINWQQDPQSNYLARLVFPAKTTSLRIEVDLVAEMAVLNPFDFFLEPSAEKFPFVYDPALATELEPYRHKAELTPRFKAYLDSIAREPTPTSTFLMELNQRLMRDVAYLIRMEPGVQTPEQTLVNASGSCRDTGWLLVQLLRHLGLAARFVSGYLIQLKSDVKSLDGPSGTEIDFTDLHAWCEVYLPGAGWIGLDPTSGLYAGEGHIPLACSPDPGSAAPITGAIEKCETTFEHRMSVTRIWEAPRVTLPYTDAQWAAIEALGHQVDADLVAGDVRLTQGGEPTFVSIDDREGGEWNTDAVGPTKRILSADLMDRLRAHYGAGSLLHYGQGKWYPGEQLPRWSLNLFWRKDGEPIWTHPELIANEHQAYGATENESRRLLEGVARRMGVEPANVFAAYEDTHYYLWRERKLPSNVDPLDARLADPFERERLRKVFSQGLRKVVGHGLPIARSPGEQKRWRSTSWFLRDKHCYLVPGDSALGYRLPLESQPWAAPTDLPWIHPPDPNQDFPDLASHKQQEQQQNARLQAAPAASDAAGRAARDARVDIASRPVRAGPPGDAVETGATAGEPSAAAARAAADLRAYESAAFVTRTAISAEPRAGRLYVFMPPTETLEDYLELVGAVEDTALEMRLPVILEGYEPPKDPRLTTLRVTPDPGVIEVNIHPAHSWEQLVDQTTHLYQAARETRLSTEKFMLDGRHTGTGGGNHFVLGGATPGDSPFLRRPDLLASMIAYWHNHPALSYLFSGLFVGPTSQAPRIDEARNDSVYEIEIAFAELRRQTELSAGSTPSGGGRGAPGGSHESPAGGPQPTPSGGGRGAPGGSHGSPAGGPQPTPSGGGRGAPGGSHESPAGGPQACPPWLIDRLLRNLLIDVSGNTHRAEFCIDKLYSPDGPTGRLGLLEMRAFEMPPHARMSLLQQLLMRSLVARFWKAPYRPERLKRWGTELHDRFMMPHFVWQDLADVVAELREFGYDMRLEWFAPHLNFRFPRLGDFAASGVEVELRLALEPWHVLGEESGPGGTARYVDATLERVQVKATGLVGDRHVLSCNGRRIPLQATGTPGEFVAAVRYRAWRAPSALHPTIDPHAPLTFDLVDTWVGRSVGGCQYHVAHPGGINYVTFPINAYEAEARRLARFFRTGHTPGPMEVAAEERNPSFPFTLDLRRV